uniref:glucose-6-phosphate dehydrogenase n=1 Tax=unclassified Rhodococcus (in: high G+C Gram-positive bacteria) TaxID=192944 RepID=UPI0020CBFFFE|nr:MULTISPECIES: glucose-6-phosphate dehydrogenase [unclassified Rhodococcus (in: high G+C Gram-positive bacteria)]
MSTDYAIESGSAFPGVSNWNNVAAQNLQRSAAPVHPSTLVIFGITGDLSRRKLLPAIYDLAHQDLLPDEFALVGFARHDNKDLASVVDTLRSAVADGARRDFDEQVWGWVSDRLHLIDGSFDEIADFRRLKSVLVSIAARTETAHCSFYMSIAPTYFDIVCSQLRSVGLHRSSRGWRRVAVEKPFGRDLSTSNALERIIGRTFGDDSVYRIDHYLGKETVQNILALRFANGMLEPLWNNRHIDHVQITMAEDIGVAGRGGYYDGVGAARDVIQNHLLQLLALVTMEEPLKLTADAVAAEKTKVLGAATATGPFEHTTARGQYTRGVDAIGNPAMALVDEEGFDPKSTTETYAAVTLGIANRRWAGVPFYLRAGKRLPKRFTEIAVTFSGPNHRLHGFAPRNPAGNVLVFRVQPDDGITLQLNAKQPGDGMEIGTVELDVTHPHDYDDATRGAYERLILDVMRGDSTLFPTPREIELSWSIVDPVIDFWASGGSPESYPAGSPGPAGADEILSRSGRSWRSAM